MPTALEALFGATSSTTSFIRQLFLLSSTDVGLFIDRGLFSRPIIANRYHIFFAFHGGADDRTCLDLLLQLVAGGGGGISGTVVRLIKTGEASEWDLGQTTEGEDEKGNIPVETPSGTRAVSLSFSLLPSPLTCD